MILSGADADVEKIRQEIDGARENCVTPADLQLLDTSLLATETP